jgi:hypothetical protein
LSHWDTSRPLLGKFTCPATHSAYEKCERPIPTIILSLPPTPLIHAPCCRSRHHVGDHTSCHADWFAGLLEAPDQASSLVRTLRNALFESRRSANSKQSTLNRTARSTFSWPFGENVADLFFYCDLLSFTTTSPFLCPKRPTWKSSRSTRLFLLPSGLHAIRPAVMLF